MTETTDDALLEGLRKVPGGVWRTYIAPDVKVIYEAINKNACTSLKWMMADLAGEDLSTFRAGAQPFIDDTEAVHHRDLWVQSPKLDRLSAEERATISPEDGWFIFAVIRDPRLRLFSAWQNRILLEIPNSQRWRDEPWFPRHPMTRETVIEDFATFVFHMENDPEMWLRAKDPHFRDQVEMLAEDVVPYSRIYELSEMADLKQDLHAHLEARGQNQDLYMPRANPTPLPVTAEVFGNGVKEAIERIYAADFERFGHLWDFSKVKMRDPWTPAQLAAGEHESELGRRIADLHKMALFHRKRGNTLRDRVAELEAQVVSLGGEVTAV